MNDGPPTELRRSTEPFVVLPTNGSSASYGVDDVRPIRGTMLSRLERTQGVLVELQGAQLGAVFRVTAPTTLIGRSSRAEVALTDTTVSWEHARLRTADDGAVVAEDLSSRNGTFVNERRVHEPTPLVDGDYLGVGGGSTLFKFSMMDAFEEGVLRTLFDLAQCDPLTGLYNRRYFDDRLRSEFLFAQRHDATLGFLFIDIDHFKRVNDTRGHPMGDAVLKVVARSIQKVMRPEDVLSRYGGEEFTVLVRASSLRNLEILGTRICHRIQALAFEPASEGLGVTVSIGISCMDTNKRFSSAEALLASADEALYAAKAGGGNCVCLARPASSERGIHLVT